MNDDNLMHEIAKIVDQHGYIRAHEAVNYILAKEKR